MYWTQPAGGYTLWLHLVEKNVDEIEVLQEIARRGVLVSPGRFHYVNGSSSVCLRISIGAVEEKLISEGIRRLSEALRPRRDNTKKGGTVRLSTLPPGH